MSVCGASWLVTLSSSVGRKVAAKLLLVALQERRRYQAKVSNPGINRVYRGGGIMDFATMLLVMLVLTTGAMVATTVQGRK
jgi:hypothetical protein